MKTHPMFTIRSCWTANTRHLLPLGPRYAAATRDTACYPYLHRSRGGRDGQPDLLALFKKLDARERSIADRDHGVGVPIGRATLMAGREDEAFFSRSTPCAFVKSAPTYLLYSKGDIALIDITPKGLADPEKTYGLTWPQIQLLMRQDALSANIHAYPRRLRLEDPDFEAYAEHEERTAWLLSSDRARVYCNDIRKELLFKSASRDGLGLDHYRALAGEMGLQRAIDRLEKRLAPQAKTGFRSPEGRLCAYRGEFSPRKVSENIAYMLAYRDARPECREADPMLEELLETPRHLVDDPLLAAVLVSRVYTFHHRFSAKCTGAYDGVYPRDCASVMRQALNAKYGHEYAHGELRPKDMARLAEHDLFEPGLLAFLFERARADVAPALAQEEADQELLGINSTYGFTGAIRDDGLLAEVVQFMPGLATPIAQRQVRAAARHFAAYDLGDRSAADHVRALATAEKGKERLRQLRQVKEGSGTWQASPLASAWRRPARR